MDNLERFITENRRKFDRLHPPGRVWNRIRTSEGIGRNRLRYGYATAALIGILIVIAGVLAIIARNSGFSGVQAAGYADETVSFYNSQYNALYNKAKPFLNSQPGLAEELGNDMQKLDSILKDIRKDLKDNAANAEVVEALIRNYRTRVMILEEMLEILKEKQDERKIPDNL
ncbi:MAG TPA: hypothetical protein P5348_06415 [Bacteroidales bacterium]|nr:hypothetical protein [Bacteroidales bacterium]